MSKEAEEVNLKLQRWMYDNNLEVPVGYALYRLMSLDNDNHPNFPMIDCPSSRIFVLYKKFAVNYTPYSKITSSRTYDVRSCLLYLFTDEGSTNIMKKDR